ncbi:MAG: phosphoribosyl-ATP diphosphatase [Alphaproteobacteria bacterium]|jgi:phosphoribosyl-ATP pyrophosphohydrolase|nr:phosphoribosyl-ATP diphosphatase [Alphaproteobacteria bacterium]|tara:strand:- start:73 stop:363 length:291 start_codon:yes stop_codon:yes gene_type:complete
MSEKIILELEKIIKKRKESTDPNSYIVKLFSKGNVKIANKLGEEAVETISAFLSEGKEEFLEESADLIFHLLIMLEAANVSLDDVLLVLKKRMKND